MINGGAVLIGKKSLLMAMNGTESTQRKQSIPSDHTKEGFKGNMWIQCFHPAMRSYH